MDKTFQGYVATTQQKHETPDYASIRMERKHPLTIRWMHWVNFPVLFTMIWSGVLIYWNDSDNAYRQPHDVYRIGIGHVTIFRFFPDWFYEILNVPYHPTTISRSVAHPQSLLVTEMSGSP